MVWMLIYCTDVDVYYILCKYVEKKLIFYMMHVIMKAVVCSLRFSNVKCSWSSLAHNVFRRPLFRGCCLCLRSRQCWVFNLWPILDKFMKYFSTKTCMRWSLHVRRQIEWFSTDLVSGPNSNLGWQVEIQVKS